MKEWIEKTDALGSKTKVGRCGGTYTHVTISLEFGMWICALFKVYLIKEFNRLIEDESDRSKLE